MKKSLLILLLLVISTFSIVVAQVEDGEWEKLKNGEVIVKEITGLNSDGSQNVRFMASIFIDAPREEVWTVLHDYDNFYRFFPNVRYTKVIKREGEIYWVDYVTKVMWVEAKYTLKFNSVELNKRIEVELDKSRPHDIRETNATWLLEDAPEGSGTIVKYSTYIDSGIAAPASLAKKASKMSLPKVVKCVKSRVESGGKWEKNEGS